MQAKITRLPAETMTNEEIEREVERVRTMLGRFRVEERGSVHVKLGALRVLIAAFDAQLEADK